MNNIFDIGYWKCLACGMFCYESDWTFSQKDNGFYCPECGELNFRWEHKPKSENLNCKVCASRCGVPAEYLCTHFTQHINGECQKCASLNHEV